MALKIGKNRDDEQIGPITLFGVHPYKKIDFIYDDKARKDIPFSPEKLKLHHLPSSIVEILFRGIHQDFKQFCSLNIDKHDILRTKSSTRKILLLVVKNDRSKEV